MTVVAYRKRKQRNLVVTRVFKQTLYLLVYLFGRLLSYRTVNHTRLTKTAATYTASVNLLGNSIVYRFYVRHYKFIRIRCLVHILYDAFFYLARYVGGLRRIRLYGAVFIIRNLVKRGNVKALNMRKLTQKCLLCISAAFLHINIKRHHFGQSLLALTYRKDVEKVRKRLGVIGTRAAADNYRKAIISIRCKKRNFGKAQCFKHVGIAKLILKCNAHKVKTLNRLQTFKCIKRNTVCPHLLCHIGHR